MLGRGRESARRAGDEIAPTTTKLASILEC